MIQDSSSSDAVVGKSTGAKEVLASMMLSPQERLVPTGKKNKRLYIGVPKELSFQENRVALAPESVELLVNYGHRVVIETKAGINAHFTDQEYSEAGAEIAYDVKKVFEADIILKVTPPLLEEIEMCKPGQTIFSPLHLPTLQADYFTKLMEKKVTAFSYEYIKDESSHFPMVRALSEIAGSAAILIASEYLSNVNNGKGVLLGGISGVPPIKVIILGAGVVGEFATKAALGLGAEVRVFDNNIYKLLRLQNNVNVRVYTSTINPTILRDQLSRADVVIGAVHSELGRTPCIITEEMVASMKQGAVIVDVSIDQGGCVETSKVTTHKHPTFEKHGVIHYCVPNIASRVAKTASYALSHVITPILLNAYESGGIDKLIYSSLGTRHGVYVYKGCLTNKHLGDRFDLPYKNLDLLLPSSM